MKKLIITTILIVVGTLTMTKSWGQQPVIDKAFNILQQTLNGIREVSKEIDVEKLENSAKTLETINKVVEQGQKYLDMYEKESSSVEGFGRLTEMYRQIQEIQKDNYKTFKVVKLGITKGVLARNDQIAWLQIQEIYLQDAKKVIKDISTLINSNKLKMMDGDRLLLLDKHLDKMTTITRASLHTNKLLIYHINKKLKSKKVLNEIEEWEKIFYGTEKKSS